MSVGHVRGVSSYECIVIRVNPNTTHLIYHVKHLNHDTASLIKHMAQHGLHNLFNKHIVLNMPSIFDTKRLLIKVHVSGVARQLSHQRFSETDTISMSFG